MTISSSDFIGSCQVDCESSKEVDIRNSISRDYYGIYHSAAHLQTLLPTHNCVSERGGMHEKLASYFCDFPPSKLERTISMSIRGYGHLLKILKTQRVKADYAITETICLKDLQEFEKMRDSLFQKEEQILNALKDMSCANS